MKHVLGKSYYRLQTSLSLASDDMDNASKGNINLLIQEAQKLLRTHREIIYDIFV